MRKLLACFLLLTLAAPAGACFGPKLYLGSGSTLEEELLYAVVSLYLKEKTGIETVRVPLEKKDPLPELREERLDLAFIPPGASFQPVVLAVPGWPQLAAGRRPLEDLQFTTFSSALAKLNRLLTAEQLLALQEKVQNGEPLVSAVRHFLAGEGWI